ncbi:hypothetical protein ACIPSJ_27270 [Streptomyces sp. NPDC090088]|uniref:hypothetical protein n=1 Tax=Streptomyces sp. NPDC090088 TaxID=3365944 RepID=UPI00380AAD04
MPPTRENTISRFRVPQKACLDTLDVRLRLSIVIVVIVIVWPMATDRVTVLLAAAALASRSSVRYLRLRR